MASLFRHFLFDLMVFDVKVEYRVCFTRWVCQCLLFWYFVNPTNFPLESSWFRCVYRNCDGCALCCMPIMLRITRSWVFWALNSFSTCIFNCSLHWWQTQTQRQIEWTQSKRLFDQSTLIHHLSGWNVHFYAVLRINRTFVCNSIKCSSQK